MAIAELARECSQLFEEIKKSNLHDSSQYDNAEEHLFQYNLWTTNNRVLPPGLRDSLDSRLKRSPALHFAMLDLLHELKAQLSDTHRKTSDTIQHTLDNILRVSRAISRSRIIRDLGDSSRDIHYDHHGLKITNVFRQDAKRHLDNHLQNSETSLQLRNRLLDTICLRQERLQKLTSRREPLSHPLLSFLPKHSALNPESSIKSSKPSDTRDKTQIEFKSDVKLEDAAKRPPIPYRTRAASQSFARSWNESELVYDIDVLLAPPKVPKEMEQFECPYCFLVYPASLFGIQQWT